MVGGSLSPCWFTGQDYLGEKIGLYFALLGHYTSWLGPLSIMGLVMSFDQLVEWNLDATLAPCFSVFVSFWAVSGVLQLPVGGAGGRAVGEVNNPLCPHRLFINLFEIYIDVSV